MVHSESRHGLAETTKDNLAGRIEGVFNTFEVDRLNKLFVMDESGRMVIHPTMKGQVRADDPS